MQSHSQKKLLQTSNLRGFVPLFFEVSMIDPDKNSPVFNSYASVDDLKKYAEDRNITLADSGLEPLLITAMDYLESQRW